MSCRSSPRLIRCACHAGQEIRVGCYQYFQPSLVYYCKREVQRLDCELKTLEFLRMPVPIYLFLPSSTWGTLEPKVRGAYRVLGRHHDLYRHCEIVVVTNQ